MFDMDCKAWADPRRVAANRPIRHSSAGSQIIVAGGVGYPGKPGPTDPVQMGAADAIFAR